MSGSSLRCAKHIQGILAEEPLLLICNFSMRSSNSSQSGIRCKAHKKLQTNRRSRSVKGIDYRYLQIPRSWHAAAQSGSPALGAIEVLFSSSEPVTCWRRCKRLTSETNQAWSNMKQHEATWSNMKPCIVTHSHAPNSPSKTNTASPRSRLRFQPQAMRAMDQSPGTLMVHWWTSKKLANTWYTAAQIRCLLLFIVQSRCHRMPCLYLILTHP